MRTDVENRSGGVDLRAHPRTPTKRKAYLVDGRKAWKCSLIDIADGGARIALGDIELPAEGAFLVDSIAKRVHLTRVVWRSEREAGLQFIESEALTGPAGGKDGAVSIATRFAWKLNAA
ncbi:PilZ domain-containing protein [Caulobacter soli]|uniref:PilZ domain-containing protein n=1 Tax=Caulobacter soli TaxID=2708539 RepID=UPI0013EB9B63|nr:PilZ domain-containing protein [Caulobacter soli]